MDYEALLRQFEHLNHMNPHTFEVEDLDRLIKSVRLVLTVIVSIGGSFSELHRIHFEPMQQQLST